MSATNKDEDNKDEKKEEVSKVFDVAKPGETAAEPTARPVIVGRSTMIKQDPMMVDDKDDEDAKETTQTQSLSSKTKITIQPLSSSEVAKEEKEVLVTAEKKPEEAKEAPKKADDTKEEVKTETPATAEPTPAKDTLATEPEKTDDDKKDEADNSGAGAVDALAGEATAKRESEKQAEEAAKKAAELESSIENKEYFVPIRETMSRRSGRFLTVLLLVCLLAVIGLNFAVDAELLDLGVEPLTDLL